MNAEIGVIGGSGFYRLLDDAATVEVDTPYGSPSDQIAIGRVGERSVAFMPRHGSHHTIPPAAINYRANLWALHSLGVRRVIAPSAAGSLQPELKPGDIVVCDRSNRPRDLRLVRSARLARCTAFWRAPSSIRCSRIGWMVAAPRPSTVW